MSYDGESDVLHTFSAVATPDWAHTYFLGIFYYFLELFLEAHDFLKEAQKSKNYFIILFYCAMGTPRGS